MTCIIGIIVKKKIIVGFEMSLCEIISFKQFIEEMTGRPFEDFFNSNMEKEEENDEQRDEENNVV